MDLRSALSITIQVADALAAAWRGIVHRDIKAGNVMVSPRQAKILDFGLAKLLDSEDSRRHPHTDLLMGIPYGTATYAAPEQARGDNGLCARGHFFRPGVLLYEMLTGRWPFRQTSIDVRHAVAARRSGAARNTRPDPTRRGCKQSSIGPSKEPKDRYQKADVYCATNCAKCC